MWLRICVDFSLTSEWNEGEGRPIETFDTDDLVNQPEPQTCPMLTGFNTRPVLLEAKGV